MGFNSAFKGLMGGRFGGRSLGQPIGRRQHAVHRDFVDLLQIRSWKAAARRREGWRKEIGETMARKGAKAP